MTLLIFWQQILESDLSEINGQSKITNRWRLNGKQWRSVPMPRRSLPRWQLQTGIMCTLCKKILSWSCSHCLPTTWKQSLQSLFDNGNWKIEAKKLKAQMQSCFSAPIQPQILATVFCPASARPNESTPILDDCAHGRAKTVPGNKVGFSFAELLASQI